MRRTCRRDPTVQLTVEGELFRTLTVGDQDTILLKLDDAGRRIASAAVNGIWYRLREGSDQPLITFGPHPSKQPEGNAIRVPRGADGGFRYPFALTEPGRHQLDLTAEGTFADGGRFSTASVVTVFVLRRAAVATAIRQLRPAGSNSVRFLVDLDVILPGRYEARVGLDAMSGTIAPAAGGQTLAPGRRTLVIEGDAAFLAALEQNPAARLTLGVQWTPPTPGPAAPTGVSVRAKPIRARDFSIPAAAAGGLLTGGVRWKLEDSDHNGRPDRLRITVPVSLQGAGCEWSARLGLDKVPVVSEVRTISYLQSGPVERPGPIETDWDLSPFFPSGALPAEQAFVFRLLPAYCADGSYYAAEEEVTPDDGSLLVARFVADLSHFELRPETPRHSGHLKLEPLDQDGDGKFDHLRATWALVTATGGRCVWNPNIAFDMESHGVGNVAMTRPGVNSVTDEIDVTLSFSLQGQSRMRYVVGELRCGPNAAFSGEDLVAPPKHPPVIDQEFALPPGKFAAQNEFKPPAPVRHAVAIDWAPASPGEPAYANLARPTNRHGDMVRLAVKSGTAKVASVDGVTAQLYRAGARGLAQPLVTGPAPYKDAVGRPFPMKRVGDAFETSFFQETAGLYQLDVTATGKLADGQPFTATHPVNLWNPAEDLLVTAFEPEGLGTAGARARITIEADRDLQVQALTEFVAPPASVRREGGQRFPLRKGRQVIVVKLPAVAPAALGERGLLQVSIKPVDPPPDPMNEPATYWLPSTGAWSNGRYAILEARRLGAGR